MIGNLKKDYQKNLKSVGFFISDHPLNQFKEIFDDYNIKIIKNFILMTKY